MNLASDKDNRNDVNSISSSNQQLLMHPKQRRDYRMLPGGIDSKILPEGIISVHAVKAAAKQPTMPSAAAITAKRSGPRERSPASDSGDM